MYVFLIEFDLRDTLQSPFSCFQFSESSGSAILTICQVSCSLITTMVLKSEGSKNKSVISRMLGFKPKNSATLNKYSSAETEVLNLNISDATMPTTKKLRVFVATWNVGGNPPSNDLNLDDFLQVQHDLADIYILGFQEIVPLNAGNILVLEDNEPAAKWLSLINRSLNKPSPPLTAGHNDDDDDDNQYYHSLRTATSLDSWYSNKISSSKVAISSTSTLLFHQKYSLKAASKQFRTESKKMLKKCNCRVEQAAVAAAGRRYNYNSRKKDSCFRKRCQRQRYVSDDDMSSEEDDHGPSTTTTCTTARSLDLSDMAAAAAGCSSSSPNSLKCIDDDDERKYGLIVSKQMVGIFLTIWVKRELVQHISHLRSSYIPRGMMGCLGNKGCISVSLSIYQTTFCVICSHLASGEKEGDELRRNMDVIEILKNTQFRRRCKVGNSSQIPDKILEHDRVIWLGDLNYRITLSYAETRKLLERNDWDSLLSKDQLKMEREAGRVFKGWREGKICFAPTYKFSFNSNTYFAETNTSKNKRRTPAWCDRILWHGNGVKQLTYKCKDCKEFRFSDHRPVYANFIVDVNSSSSAKKRYFPPESNMKIEIEELLPPSSTSK